MNMLQSGARISKRLAETFTALASEHRLDILSALSRSGEMDVSTLCDLLGRNQPAVSHDLMILRMTGLIHCRRDGKHNYYRVEPKLLRDLEMGLKLVSAPR
jgi:ArsR family transcriptional regulator